jgi:signal transduction histidine kinase
MPYWTILGIGGLASAVLVPLALPTGHFWEDIDLEDAIPFVIVYLAGAFVFLKRPEQPVARWLLVAGTGFTTALALSSALSWIVVEDPPVPLLGVGNVLEQMCEVIGGAAIVAAFALFPNGVYHRSYERWTVRFVFLLVPFIPLLLLLALPTFYLNDNVYWATAAIPNPMFVPSLAALGPIAVAGWWSRLGLWLVAAILLALRYRRLTTGERLQARWPLLAVVAFVLIGVGPIRGLIEWGMTARVLPPYSGTVAYVSTNALLPAGLVVALLRYRLFDLDAVLRKSIVYGALWLAITMGYVGMAAILGVAAGARFPLGWAILGTIAATLAFQPARRWLERVADHLVFGERLGGYELLARLGAVLEQSVLPEDLAPGVAGTVRHGLGATWVRVSVRRGVDEGSETEPIGASGISLHDTVAPALVAPLLDRAEQVGAIECGPKVEGAYTARDQDLLATLGKQAALALRNAHLTAELAERLQEVQHQSRELTASRARLVQAEESARRRIERDLHDGVQQELVALVAKTRLARNQLARDPAIADRTLAELQSDVRETLEDLRELVRGIHPPVLSDKGLVAAVEARVVRLPSWISVVHDGLATARFAPEVEGAAYFFVCEGLANVLKHAQARRATVRLADGGDQLYVEITDDGNGFEVGRAHGTGLVSLADRIEALGGRLEVISQLGAGTRLWAELPVGEPQRV